MSDYAIMASVVRGLVTFASTTKNALKSNFAFVPTKKVTKQNNLYCKWH